MLRVENQMYHALGLCNKKTGFDDRFSPNPVYWKKGSLDNRYRSGLQTFGSFFNCKLHLLPFFKGMKSITDNCGMVHKNIGTIFL